LKGFQKIYGEEVEKHSPKKLNFGCNLNTESSTKLTVPENKKQTKTTEERLKRIYFIGSSKKCRN
jgi:hypothetical protein